MTTNLSPSILNTMKDWVELHIGLKVSDARIKDFEKSLLLASADSGFLDPNEFVTSIVRGNHDEHTIGFISFYLTVGETYFFRDSLSYHVLKTEVIPDVIAGKNAGDSISIWSAGCATGEEPYSLAMTILSQNRSNKDLKAKILATDVNKHSLQIAKRGIYRRWSFRDVPSFIKDKYFTASIDDRYHIKNEVKNLVNFSHLNLASESYPSLMNGTENVDIIFCRNVLIYFSPDKVKEVLSKFHKSLNDGGWLFLAPSEIPHPAPKTFSIKNMHGAIVLKKEDTHCLESSPIRIVKSNYSYFGKSMQEPAKSFESMVDTPKEMDVSYGKGSDRVSGSYTIPTIDDKVEHISEISISDDLASLEEQVSRYFESGNYGAVIDAVPQIPNSNLQSSSETLVMIAKSYANTGNLEAASDWCETLISKDSVNPRWYYLRATIENEKGEEETALKSLRQAIFLDDRYVIAHFVLGNLYRQQGDKNGSKKCFEYVSELLSDCDKADIVPDSDGLTVGQLSSIVSSLGGNF